MLLLLLLLQAALAPSTQSHVRCVPQLLVNAYPPNTGYLHRNRRPGCDAFGGDCKARDSAWASTTRSVWRRGRWRMHSAGGKIEKKKAIDATLLAVRNGVWHDPHLVCPDRPD